MAMNMSITQLVHVPATVTGGRSLWREIIDMLIEGPRTAADEIDEYLTHHQYDTDAAD
jgi:hypothetical protein